MYATCPAQYPLACAPASLFTAVVLSSINLDARSKETLVRTSPSNGGEFDFIVVGGGSAGCVVASRLSENPNWRVLLLEAGPEEPDLNVVPAFNRFFLRTRYDWQFQTQQSGWDAGQYIPRGRSLGGGSAINGMLYSRGHPEDYDSWAAMGNRGWAYDDVLPYFKKSEHNHDDVDSALHGRVGPMQVSHFPHRDENVPIALKAFEQIGLRFNKDHTSRVQNGSTLLQFTQYDGVRSSTSRAFIDPVRRLRPNLQVRTLSSVRRVIVSPSTLQAVGVEWDGPQGRRSARARREVVVAAGALMSPQILMLSGLGPRDHLAEAGIKTVLHLPAVGQRLKDHLTSAYTVNFTLTRTATSRLDSLPQRLADLARYQDGRHGPLSATGIRQVAAFFRTSHDDPRPHRPTIHLEIIGQLTDPERGSRCPGCTFPKEDSIWYNQFRFSPVMLHPRYHGQVRLNTTAPLAKPLVYLNISLDEDEMRTWVEGFQTAARLGQSEAFRRAGITLDTPPIAGCAAGVQPGSDEYWACAGKLGLQTWGHLTGSCRMGRTVADSVVDDRLRVHGVRGLRVVDASVIPDLPSGNTNAPTIMVAEKGAEMIRRDHQQRPRTASSGDKRQDDDDAVDQDAAVDKQSDVPQEAVAAL